MAADWRKKIDIGHLSDDDSDYVRFTGTFVGMAAQDLSGQHKKKLILIILTIIF